MSNIRKIFVTDLKHLCSSLFIIIIIIGVAFLPALYAWCNIYSNWDPYGNTGNMKIAVVSLDQGYTDEDGNYSNVGKTLITELKGQTTIDWQFVKTENEAIGGVASGKYYGAIVVPEKFTSNMYNVFLENVDKPELKFYQNQKKNPVANKISDTVATKIESNIDEQFVKVMTTTVFKDVNGLSNDMQSQGGVDSVIDRMNQINQEIQSYEKTIDTVLQGNAVLSSAVGAAKSDTQTMKKKTDESSQDLSQASQNLTKTQTSLDEYSKEVNLTMDTVKTSLADMVTILNEGKMSGDVTQMTKDASACATDANNIVKDLTAISNTLVDSSTVPETAKETISSMLSTMTTIQTELDSISSNDISGQVGDNLKTQETSTAAAVTQTIADVQSVQDRYNNNLVPQMENCITSLQNTINSADTLMQSMSSTLAGMGNVFSALQVTVQTSNTSLEKTRDALDNLSSRLTETTEKVKAASEDEKVKVLMNTLSGDPEKYGEFFSQPVTITSQAIYPVENYGSAVTPFYTVLAIWVGGIILCAILKVKPSPELYPDAKGYEMFFGRYATFFCMAEVQTLITVLGNLFLLKVQCIHPFLFWFASAYASLAFSLLIYSLVVAFGDVGKALAVVIVVLQIAGSSGTYPIELLPDFFQKVYIFFPFPYAINAMRECIAGMYGSDYVIYLLELSIFIVVALLIGLWIQKAFFELNHFMEKRMEDTEMM